MGKPSGKANIDTYYLTLFTGICQGAADLLAWWVGEKQAWGGSLSDHTSGILVHQEELFGGLSKEGGVAGFFDYMPGKPDQVLTDDMAVRLGYPSAAEAPGYRGVSSAFFYQGQADRKGFYWTATTPYMKDLWFTMRRKPAGLNPDKALIGAIAGSAQLFDIAIDCSPGATDAQLDTAKAAMIPFLETLRGLVDGGSTVYLHIYGFDGAGQITFTVDGLLGSAPVPITSADIDSAQAFVSGLTRSGGDASWAFGVQSYAAAFAGWYEGDPTVTVNHIMLAGGPPTQLLGGGLTTQDLTDMALTFWGDSTIPRYVINLGYDDLTYSGQYDNTPGDGVPVVEIGDDAALLALLNGYITIGPTSFLDANPANIIYECLTNTVWGMGAGDASLDMDSFQAAQDTLFAEAFGLSMAWMQQASIEDFVKEVLDHINAVLFVSPRNGLLTLKLLRADYNVEDLPVITPDNAVLRDFQRKGFGEITNEVVVTWTNPANEQDETVTAQDLGVIAAQGAVVSSSRNYYGVRRKALAQTLAYRDLRATAYPLATLSAECDRSQYDLTPGACVVVTWPEYGLDQVVCRVLPVDYGKPGDHVIKAALIEDVFGLELDEFSEPVTTGWTDPKTTPTAMDFNRAFTAPYFFAVKALGGPAGSYPEVISMVLAADSAPDCGVYQLYVEETDVGGGTAFEDAGTRANLAHAALPAALDAEAETTTAFTSLIGGFTPGVGDFAMIGAGADDAFELTVITAVASGVYTLQRGALDTVPKTWPTAAPVWFFAADDTMYDPAVRADGETVRYQARTRTSGGVLTSAPVFSAVQTERPYRPLRPANVTIAGEAFATDVIDTSDDGLSTVPITWANRNRLTEDTVVLAWDAADTTVEAGQTTTVTVLTEGGVVITTIDGLTGTSYDLAKAAFGAYHVGDVRVTSKRDGIESLQGHTLRVRVNHPSFDETAITFDDTGHTWDEG